MYFVYYNSHIKIGKGLEAFDAEKLSAK